MSDNKAVQKLDALYKSVREFPGRTVALSSETAAQLLDYIEELEAKVPVYEKFVVGDVVQIIKDDSGIFNWMVGRTGTVVEIKEDDERHPVVIEFPSKLRARAHYTELRRTGE